MNTLQTIYNKLSDKTELAKHEVNLGALDIVKKKLADFEKKVSEAGKVDGSVYNNAELVKEGFEKIEKFRNDFKTLYNTGDKQFRKVLVDYSSLKKEYDKEKKYYDDLDDESDAMAKDIQKVEDLAKELGLSREFVQDLWDQRKYAWQKHYGNFEKNLKPIKLLIDQYKDKKYSDDWILP
jgi:hypothetical protein